MKVLLPVIAALIAASAAFGCSQQGEGERCSCKNDNDDCADGLTCVAGKQTQICCPAQAQRTEAGCLQASLTCEQAPTTGAGGGSSSSSSGAGGAGGASSSSTTTSTSTGMGGMGGAGGAGGAGG